MGTLGLLIKVDLLEGSGGPCSPSPPHRHTTLPGGGLVGRRGGCVSFCGIGVPRTPILSPLSPLPPTSLQHAGVPRGSPNPPSVHPQAGSAPPRRAPVPNVGVSGVGGARSPSREHP